MSLTLLTQRLLNVSGQIATLKGIQFKKKKKLHPTTLTHIEEDRNVGSGLLKLLPGNYNGRTKAEITVGL
jgi:hypothetical protein